LISTELNKLLDDARYQFEHHAYGDNEIVVRFHHRLVLIHCFPNGNGRHARFVADLLSKAVQLPLFSWGGAHSFREKDKGSMRSLYLAALRSAD
jgi:fido (protein-threonine AMPylation protein)